MIKTFLLIYGLGTLLVILGWLCYSLELNIWVTSAIATGVISISIVVATIVSLVTGKGGMNE